MLRADVEEEEVEEVKGAAEVAQAAAGREQECKPEWRGRRQLWDSNTSAS